MTPLPPVRNQPIRANKYRLQYMCEFAAAWSWIARKIRQEIRAENCKRSQRGILFCHMPISQADYLTDSGAGT
jgi:hypothetical protein